MKMRGLLIVAILIGCGPRSAPSSSTPEPGASAPSAAPAPSEPVAQTPPDNAVPPTAPPMANQADGGPCLVPGDCASGVCEGQGCDANAPGVCAPKQRACTRNLRTYCGCDGKTFQASGSCPGQRYNAPGACAASAP